MYPAQSQPGRTGDSLAAVRAAIEARHYGEAKTLAATVLERDPELAEAWFLLGVAAEGIGDYEAAQSSLAQAAQRHPDVNVVVRLATCLWRLGRLDEALARIEGIGAAAAHDHDPQLVRANVLHALGRYEEARAVAEAALRRTPDSALLVARLGASLMRLRMYEQARAQFLRAAQLSLRLAHCRLIRVDPAAWAELEQPLSEPLSEPHLVHAGSSEALDARFVVLVACDSVYLNRYGAAFVRSFAANAAAAARLHLHVIDPDDAFPGFLDGLIHAVPLPGLRVTIEYSQDDVAEHLNARRTYYSCARFLQLPGLLREYRAPIVLLDVDAVVEHPLDALAALVRDRDVALVRREPPDSPWLDIVANHVVVAPNESAMRFAERVRRFIALHCTRAELKWHLDQIALYCVLEMTEAYGEPVRFASIPGELQQRIWHIGNFYRYLLDEERFRRHAAPFTQSSRK